MASDKKWFGLKSIVNDKPTEPVQNNLATIEVKDIKQYLVEEYDRSRSLERKNSELLEELEKYEIVDQKYSASLVTLDEFNKRIKLLQKQIEGKDNKIISLKNDLKLSNDKLNDFKIRENRLQLTEEAMKDTIITSTKSSIIDSVMNTKGVLSKDKVLEIIREATHGNE